MATGTQPGRQRRATFMRQGVSFFKLFIMIYLPMWQRLRLRAERAVSQEPRLRPSPVVGAEGPLCWPAAAISKLFILLVSYVLRRYGQPGQPFSLMISLMFAEQLPRTVMAPATTEAAAANIVMLS